MPLVVVAVSSLLSTCANSSAAIRGCRAQNLYRAPSGPGSPLGKDDDPILPAAHLHRPGHLRQRRNPLGGAFGYANLSPNDLALYHGSPRSPHWFHPLFGNRRFFVPARLPVRHDACESGEPSGGGPLSRSEGRNLGSLDASTARSDGGQPGSGR